MRSAYRRPLGARSSSKMRGFARVSAARSDDAPPPSHAGRSGLTSKTFKRRLSHLTAGRDFSDGAPSGWVTSTRGDLLAGEARRADHPIHATPRVAEQPEQSLAIGRQLRSPPQALSRPSDDHGPAKDAFGSPEVLPGVPVRPSVLPRRGTQRAASADLLQ